MFRPLALIAALCLVSHAAAPYLAAETLHFSDGSSLANTSVLRFDGDRLVYRSPTGPEAAIASSEVVRIDAPASPAFSAAELAFSEHRTDDAIDAYAKALRIPDDPAWLRQRAATRLLQAAGSARRFDLAVDGYIALVSANPDAARGLRPVLPEPRSTFLDTALGPLAVALRDEKMDDARREPLLLLQLDIARTRRDAGLTLRTLHQVARLANPGESSRKALRDFVATHLESARSALQRPDPESALAQLSPALALAVDGDQQADVLFVSAEARSAVAARTNDPAALAKASLAYLRLVAHFPTSPHAPDALLAAADLQRRSTDNTGAARLYAQFATAYPSHPSAAEARDRAHQLAATTSTNPTTGP